MNKKMSIKLFAVVVMCSVFAFMNMFPSVHANSNKKVEGKTYYISASSGKDSNNGLSETAAWKSFKNLKGLKLDAGDKVLLKSGDSWLEKFYLKDAVGTKENPIVISSYGEGEMPKLALFEDSVPLNSTESLMYIENSAGIEFKNLDIGFCAIGMNLHYDMVTNMEYVLIENCHFHDIYGFNQGLGDPMYPHAVSIIVTSRIGVPGDSDPSLIGLYINKCTTYDAGALFTYGGRIGGTGYNVKDFYVTDCVMRNNAYYGISICNITGGYMDNCKIFDCGSRYAPMGSMAIMMSCKDFTVMNSEIAFQQRLEDNPDGGGIDFEHMTYDVDFINNYIHDNSGVGVMFYSSHGDSSHQNKRLRFLYNVFENNNRNFYNPGGAELISLPLYSLVDGAILNNKYMKSNNMFTMYMDASVQLGGNEEYSYDKQGKVWPLLDFDDVRDYVINGKPLPQENVIVKSNSLSNDTTNYLIGLLGSLAILTVVAIVISIVSAIRRKKANEQL
ncbi:MAG: right-handed parallel beta-helix repeat-containing protein [Oscillospiraceae bacterium]|nr:right-handed parallel beta-helix repeat-containing protein [Oscillospiraceae bacterium]